MHITLHLYKYFDFKKPMTCLYMCKYYRFLYDDYNVSITTMSSIIYSAKNTQKIKQMSTAWLHILYVNYMSSFKLLNVKNKALVL